MIEKNDTWQLVKKPNHRKVIGLKQVSKTKLNSDGSINKHKARLVIKGYAQEVGADCTDTFALVPRHDTIKILIALAAQKNQTIYQLDVKSAFLNRVLDEEIYIEQPVGFLVKGKEDYVYKLKRP